MLNTAFIKSTVLGYVCRGIIFNDYSWKMYCLLAIFREINPNPNLNPKPNPNPNCDP